MYRGELAISKILYAKNEYLHDLKDQAKIYPQALKKRMIDYFMFEAGFSLLFLKESNKDDKYYFTGHVFRMVSCLNQVLFACNDAYCINEKRAVDLIETFKYKPRDYQKKVNTIFSVLAMHVKYCYLLVDSLYFEVKKIVSKINK